MRITGYIFAGVFYANDEFMRSGLRKLIGTHLGHQVSTKSLFLTKQFKRENI